MAVLLDTGLEPGEPTGRRLPDRPCSTPRAPDARGLRDAAGRGLGPDGSVVVRRLHGFTAESSGPDDGRNERRPAEPHRRPWPWPCTASAGPEHTTAARTAVVRSGNLMVVDMTRPFDFAWSGPGSSTSLQVPIAELGLRWRRCSGRRTGSRQSPLRAGQPAPGGSDARRGEAERLPRRRRSASRARSWSRAARPARSSGDEVTGRSLDRPCWRGSTHYVRQHLRDPELRPDSVAGALAVSRRQLFRVCTLAEFSLEQQVIGRRLEGARAELRTPAGRTRTIAAVASGGGSRTRPTSRAGSGRPTVCGRRSGGAWRSRSRWRSPRRRATGRPAETPTVDTVAAVRSPRLARPRRPRGCRCSVVPPCPWWGSRRWCWRQGRARRR